MKRVIVDVKFDGDSEEYRSQLTKLLQMISSAGAAIFEGLEEESGLK